MTLASARGRGIARRSAFAGPFLSCNLQPCRMPMTWGVRRPRVVLPLEAEHWTDDRRRAVLAHEFAHVRRHDWLVQIAGRGRLRGLLVQSALLARLPAAARRKRARVRRRRRESRRRCPDYAGHLLQIVQAARVDDRRWRSALAMARSSQLEQRFAALLLAARSRRPVSGRRIAVIAALAVVSVVPLAAMSLAPILDATIQVQTARLPRRSTRCRRRRIRRRRPFGA